MTPARQPHPQDYIRPEVMRFASAMETILRKHDGKKDGWKECGFNWLLDRIHEELKEAEGCRPGPYWEMDAARELIDVANFCMMFFDNLQPCSTTDLASHTSPPTPAPDNVIYSLVFHLPKQFPCIKARQLAYKEFEDEGGEGWNSIPDSPILQEDDIIQIIRGSRAHTPAAECNHSFSSCPIDWSNHDRYIAKSERERVLVLVDHAIEHCPDRGFCMHQIQMIREGKKIAWEGEESLRAQHKEIEDEDIDGEVNY